MRSRWLDLGALPALACLTESLWLSIVAALVARVSWPLVLGGTLAIMAVPTAATVAARAAWLSTRVPRDRRRGALAGMARVDRPADAYADQPRRGLALVDLLFVVLASWLGIRIGEPPWTWMGRWARGPRRSRLIFLALLLARLAHQPFAAAGVAVTGGGRRRSSARRVARFGESLTMVDRRYGVSGWTWFAGILMTIAAILLIAVILAALHARSPSRMDALGHLRRPALPAPRSGVRCRDHRLRSAACPVLGARPLSRAPPQLAPAQQGPAFPHSPAAPTHEPRWQRISPSARCRLAVARCPVGGGYSCSCCTLCADFGRATSHEPHEERESLLSASDLLSSARLRLSHLVARLPRRQAAPSSPAEAVRASSPSWSARWRRSASHGTRASTARQYLLRVGAMHEAPPSEQTAVLFARAAMTHESA